MKYFQDYKLSPLLTKALIIMGGTFLAGFSNELVASQDFHNALQSGIKLLIPAFWGAFGFDQLTFNFLKQPEVKAMVVAMQVKKEN